MELLEEKWKSDRGFSDSQAGMSRMMNPTNVFNPCSEAPSWGDPLPKTFLLTRYMDGAWSSGRLPI